MAQASPENYHLANEPADESSETGRRLPAPRGAVGRAAPVVRFIGDDPQATAAWARGSEGERRLALGLRAALGDRAVLLHHRKAPGARGPIDHIVVAASGIWLVGAESQRGRVKGRDAGGEIEYRLYVGGRDRSRLIESLEYQVRAVRAALPEIGLGVRGALCFTDASWRPFAKPLHVGSVTVTWPRALARQIAEAGPLDKHDVLQAAIRLGQTLTPAPAPPPPHSLERRPRP